MVIDPVISSLAKTELDGHGDDRSFESEALKIPLDCVLCVLCNTPHPFEDLL